MKISELEYLPRVMPWGSSVVVIETDLPDAEVNIELLAKAEISNPCIVSKGGKAGGVKLYHIANKLK